MLNSNEEIIALKNLKNSKENKDGKDVIRLHDNKYVFLCIKY